MRTVFMAVSSLALLASTTAPQAPPDPSPGLIALGPRPQGSPALSRAEAQAGFVPRFSEEVLRDPAERFALMEQLRVEIVARTRSVPEPRWQGEVRPSLRHQLERAGLRRGDVDFLLWEVDQARTR
jgi:hypothetical protein